MHVSSFDFFFLHKRIIKRSRKLHYNVEMKRNMKAIPHQQKSKKRGAKEKCADKESKIEFAIRIRRAANRAISVCLMRILHRRIDRWLTFMNLSLSERVCVCKRVYSRLHHIRLFTRNWWTRFYNCNRLPFGSFTTVDFYSFFFWGKTAQLAIKYDI